MLNTSIPNIGAPPRSGAAAQFVRRAVLAALYVLPCCTACSRPAQEIASADTLPRGAASIQPPAVRPPIRESGFSTNTTLPEGHPHRWNHPRADAPRLTALPLNEDEMALDRYVQRLRGSVDKLPAEVLDPRFKVSLDGRAYLRVDLAHAAAAGQLGELPLLNQIVELDLGRTDVTDKDLLDLAGANNLVVLNLTYTQVGNGGLISLGRLPKLRLVVLFNTQVTPDGIEALRRDNPLIGVMHPAGASPWKGDF